MNFEQSYCEQNREQSVALSDTFTLERYRQFARNLPLNEGRILDVGCAEGRGGQEFCLHKPLAILSGLDCVPERLGKLPSCYQRSITGITTNIPGEDQSFDGILAGEFIEHLYPHDVDRTLCEFNRILKIGGYLLMTTPNPYSLNMRRKKGSVYGVAHLSQHYPECLRARLKMHGFSKIKIIGSGKASLKIGQHFPWLSVYGSYMVIACKF